MNNPFSTLDLKFLRDEKNSNKPVTLDLAPLLGEIDISSMKGLRDILILKLRSKYRLKPNEIRNLNIPDLDMDARLLKILSRRQRSFLAIDEKDIPDFRRWLSVRKLFADNSGALIISLHWTAGRAKPHQRISTRGLYQITMRYASGHSYDNQTS
jgi:site-specific recombinase XerC